MVNLDFGLLEKNDFDEAYQIITDDNYGTYSCDIKDKDVLCKIHKNELAQAFKSEDDYIFSLKKNHNIIGVLHINKLVWDSTYFEKEMYKIRNFSLKNQNLKKSMAYQMLSRVLNNPILKNKHMSYNVNTENLAIIHSLNLHGFLTMSTLMTFRHILNPIQRNRIENVCRSAIPRDLPYLKDIAMESFTLNQSVTNRFIADPSLPDTKKNNFHSVWLENMVQTELVDEVLIVEIDDVPIGFISLQIDSKLTEYNISKGIIVLIAVSKLNRGQGLGSRLVVHGVDWFQDKVDYVDVGTEISNIPAQLLYLRNKFRPIKTEYCLSKIDDLSSIF